METSVTVVVMLMPPMLTFYNGPATLDDAVHHIAAKALEAVGVSCANYKRWSWASLG